MNDTTYTVETPEGPLHLQPTGLDSVYVSTTGVLFNPNPPAAYTYRGKPVHATAVARRTPQNITGWTLAHEAQPWRSSLYLTNTAYVDLSTAARRIVAERIERAVAEWAQTHGNALWLAEFHYRELRLALAREKYNDAVRAAADAENDLNAAQAELEALDPSALQNHAA